VRLAVTDGRAEPDIRRALSVDPAKAAGQETSSRERSATGFGIASKEKSALRRDSAVVIAFIECLLAPQKARG